MAKRRRANLYKLRIMKIKDIFNLEIEGVDSKDYPDFCDAFFSYGEIDGRELTEDELDKLADNYPEELNEMAYQSLI